MNTADLPRLTALGQELDTSPERFGILRDSSEFAGDGDALRARMAEDGYLFLPGLLRRAEVLEARGEIVRRLAERGCLDPDSPPVEAVALPGERRYFMPDLAEGNEPLLRVLYEGPMMDLFRRFFGGPVRHFDYTWMRSVTPGGGTAPHCDIVYMGRGTKKLCTAWTPLGDIPIEIGGLMILENSHRHATDRLRAYLGQDVDTYCENGPNAEKIQTGQMNWEHWDGSGQAWDGSISHDPVALRDALGGRWLTASYRAGDVLVFSMATVHASLDNGSDRIRLSSDTRYQPASEPADERWIGERPIAHGKKAKIGRIC